MKTLFVVLSLVFSISAFGGRTDDFCTLSTIDGHGFRCKVVHYSDGSQASLMVKNYVLTSDSEERKARSRLLIEQIVETHFREGGGSVKIRFRDKKESWYERPCNRVARTFRPYCYDAVPVKD